ncbi:hypothetical protein ACT691_06935 [Vibrio metschnikovii]
MSQPALTSRLPEHQPREQLSEFQRPRMDVGKQRQIDDPHPLAMSYQQ